MNEPVAHRFKWEEKMSWQYGDGYDATGVPNDPDYFAYEPLYTHPVKTLTDEEIQDLWADMDWSGQPELEFARAILKKANEK